MSDERTPLLRSSEYTNAPRSDQLGDHHNQFCQLIGMRPHDLPPDQEHNPHPQSLYSRAVALRDSQSNTYMFTATVTNMLILSQVVIGATITGLGASDSSHILITVFAAMNTVIAGLVAFLKSRGQPMRAKMFRDDLERVVDEIENSATMWLGISKGSHGYDAIDIDDQVTVRGEVARLTRLYDKAVKTNTLNDPDMYSSGAPGDPHAAALKDKSAIAAPVPAPAPLPGASTAAAAAPVPVPEDAEDASPATKPAEPVKPKPEDSTTTDKPAEASASKSSSDATKVESGGNGDSAKPTSPEGDSSASSAKPKDEAQKPESAPAPTAAVSSNPDESPASAARP